METAALEHTVGRQARAARGDYESSMAPVPRPAVARTDEFQYWGMQEMEDGGVAALRGIEKDELRRGEAGEGMGLGRSAR
jgi:hypothetical protein